MRKIKKALMITAVCVLALAGTTLVVLYSVGDRIINEAIDREIARLEQSTGDNTTATEDIQAAPGENSSSPTAGDEATDAPGQKDSAAQTPASGKTGSAAGPDSRSGNNTAAGSQSKTQSTVTADKINAVRGDITAADKVAAAAMVMKRLTASDISTLQGFLAGGLTGEEKDKAKQIAYSRFSAAEIEKIKELYYKYMK